MGTEVHMGTVDMGVHIEKIDRQKGTTYRAQIVIKDGGEILHRQSKSFTAGREAVSWARKREHQLQKVLDDPQEFNRLTGKGGDQLLKDLIGQVPDRIQPALRSNGGHGP